MAGLFGASAGAADTSFLATTSQQGTQSETVELGASGPATVELDVPGASASTGSPP